MPGETTMSWALLIGLGAFHGVNPGMGWLFAVALGMQERRRSAVVRALVPLAAIGRGWWRGLTVRWWEAGVVVLGLSAPLLACSIALGRSSALEFFELVCPSCGTVARRGKDFLFRQARCGKCGHVW